MATKKNTITLILDSGLAAMTDAKLTSVGGANTNIPGFSLTHFIPMYDARLDNSYIDYDIFSSTSLQSFVVDSDIKGKIKNLLGESSISTTIYGEPLFKQYSVSSSIKPVIDTTSTTAKQLSKMFSYSNGTFSSTNVTLNSSASAKSKYTLYNIIDDGGDKYLSDYSESNLQLPSKTITLSGSTNTPDSLLYNIVSSDRRTYRATIPTASGDRKIPVMRTILRLRDGNSSYYFNKILVFATKFSTTTSTPNEIVPFAVIYFREKQFKISDNSGSVSWEAFFDLTTYQFGGDVISGYQPNETSKPESFAGILNHSTKGNFDILYTGNSDILVAGNDKTQSDVSTYIEELANNSELSNLPRAVLAGQERKRTSGNNIYYNLQKLVSETSNTSSPDSLKNSINLSILRSKLSNDVTRGALYFSRKYRFESGIVESSVSYPNLILENSTQDSIAGDLHKIDGGVIVGRGINYVYRENQSLPAPSGNFLLFNNNYGYSNLETGYENSYMANNCEFHNLSNSIVMSASSDRYTFQADSTKIYGLMNSVGTVIGSVIGDQFAIRAPKNNTFNLNQSNLTYAINSYLNLNNSFVNESLFSNVIANNLTASNISLYNTMAILNLVSESTLTEIRRIEDSILSFKNVKLVDYNPHATTVSASRNISNITNASVGSLNNSISLLYGRYENSYNITGSYVNMRNTASIRQSHSQTGKTYNISNSRLESFTDEDISIYSAYTGINTPDSTSFFRLTRSVFINNKNELYDVRFKSSSTANFSFHRPSYSYMAVDSYTENSVTYWYRKQVQAGSLDASSKYGSWQITPFDGSPAANNWFKTNAYTMYGFKAVNFFINNESNTSEVILYNADGSAKEKLNLFGSSSFNVILGGQFLPGISNIDGETRFENPHITGIWNDEYKNRTFGSALNVTNAEYPGGLRPTRVRSEFISDSTPMFINVTSKDMVENSRSAGSPWSIYRNENWAIWSSPISWKSLVDKTLDHMTNGDIIDGNLRRRKSIRYIYMPASEERWTYGKVSDQNGLQVSSTIQVDVADSQRFGGIEIIGRAFGASSAKSGSTDKNLTHIDSIGFTSGIIAGGPARHTSFYFSDNYHSGYKTFSNSGDGWWNLGSHSDYTATESQPAVGIEKTKTPNNRAFNSLHNILHTFANKELLANSTNANYSNGGSYNFRNSTIIYNPDIDTNTIIDSGMRLYITNAVGDEIILPVTVESALVPKDMLTSLQNGAQYPRVYERKFILTIDGFAYQRYAYGSGTNNLPSTAFDPPGFIRQ